MHAVALDWRRARTRVAQRWLAALPGWLAGWLAARGMEAVVGAKSNDRGWAFFQLEIAGPAAQVQAAVPDEWLWKRPRRQCGKLPLKPKPAHGNEQGLHATVLLKLPGSALHPEVARLREVCRAAKHAATGL